jgi:aspartyl-tRNA(Asn)/glutamyl-tRNA(Gln) amidotransferase subunit A
LTRAAIMKFEELGARVEGVSLPRLEYSLAAYYILMCSEVSSNLARYDGIKYGYSVERGKLRARDLKEVYELSRGRGFGEEAKRRVMLGTYALSAGYAEAYYKQALKVSSLIRQDFQRAFTDHDLLLGPVSPTPPFRLGEKVEDPLAMYLSDIYTTPVNLSGNPGLSVPCGFVNLSRPSQARGTLPSSGEGRSVGEAPLSLPVGLQIIGPHFAEDRILAAAFAYEQLTEFYKNKPKL